MTQTISFDPAREITAKFRINRQADKTFVFTQDGSDLDITGFTWQLFIKRYPGDRVNQISLTLGNGLSIPVYESNILEAHFTSAQTNIEQGQYYWELYRTDIEQTWLNGWATFSYGPQDNENDTITLDVSEDGAPISVDITSAGGVPFVLWDFSANAGAWPTDLTKIYIASDNSVYYMNTWFVSDGAGGWFTK